MKFMCLMKSDETQPFGPPPPELYAAMEVYVQDGLRSGMVVDMGGLLSSAAGTIVSLVDGTVKATDGPFTEARELVGGYAVVEVHSKAEADRGRPPADADPRRPLARVLGQLRGPAGRRPRSGPDRELTRPSGRGRAVV